MTLTSVDFDPFADATLLRTTASTESQRELWTASQLGPDASAAFNESISLRLRGSLNREALDAACRALASHHEALQSSFSADGTTLVVEDVAPTVTFEDLAPLNEAERERALAEAFRQQVNDAFDLGHGPLCRLKLLRLGPQEHLLLVSAHHIVCDGWSMSVLLTDLATLYSKSLTGESLALGGRPRFSDYADAERKATGTEEYKAAERYWLDRFAGEIPVADLPSDRPRPPLKTYTSDRVDYQLDAPLVASLKEVGARNGASFFVTLLAGFSSLIYRLSGAESQVIGIPAAGQSFTGQPNLVGHCVNMLPLRASVTGEVTFSELLKIVRRELLDAYEHQQLTFGALVQKLALPRDPSRLPLINITFNVDQALSGDALKFEGLTCEVKTTPRAFETFDVFLNAAEKQGAVVLETQYNADLYDRATIERWLGEFETMLRDIVRQPQVGIGKLELLTESEAAQLEQFNRDADRDYPAPHTLGDLLWQQLDSDPARVLLIATDGEFTTAQIRDRAAQLAGQLRSRGIRRGSLVGISLTRSSHLLVAVLAVLRSGAAYVPLDPSFPSDRLKFMAEDSGLSLLISERKLEADLPAPGLARLFIDDTTSEFGAWRHDGALDALPDDPAYVIYTSGSTGKPKGVVVPHGAVVNFLRSMAERPGFKPSDRLLAVTTLSFDIAVLELMLPVLAGGTIVLATSTESMDGAALRNLIGKHSVSVLQATPATWRLLLAAGEEFRRGFKALCGGEALPRSLAEELLSKGVELWNMYGPTETTVWSTCQQILASDRRIRVGYPIANTQIYVVDNLLRRTPIGVTGELCIAGDGVTLGYLHRPELTADRFVPNPFGKGLLYRTGDLARILADGSLECLGRSDGQVKLRGYRIELGEIETVLGKLQSVKQAVVVVREDRPGDQRLTAYVVPAASMPEHDEIREFLRKSIPDYMVPQHFVEMAAFPLTPNGKVDKKKLPAPIASAAASTPTGDYAPPTTSSEQLLQKIWQKVLGIERISTNDDFFQLGGHSLLAAQVMAQITRETEIELSMRRLFEAPTIRALGRILDEAARGSIRHDAIPRRPVNAPAPLSPMQQRLWFMEEMNPGTSVYNLPACFRIKGVLNADALERALDALANRHSTLRTTIGWQDGKLVQRVNPELHFDLTPTDLSALPPAEREAKMMARLHELANSPFSLSEGPLATASLFILGPTETVLFFMPHHAIWDGWSFDIFLDELDRFYTAFCQGLQPSLPELPVSYGDYAQWYQTWESGPELTRQTEFWIQQLAGELPILDLPTDHPRPVAMTYAGATEAFEIPHDLMVALSGIGQRCGATLYMVLLAAFDVLLYRLTGQSDIIVGTPIRGRSRPELESLIGYFVNALVLRMNVDGSESFDSLLQRVRTGCVQAFGHQDMPFELLVQKLKIERDTSRTPLYSAFFTFQDVRNRRSSIGDLSYDQIHVHAPVSPTDLSLWVKQLDEVVVGGLDYATDLFTRETACRWLSEYQEVLRSIAANASVQVARLPLHTPEENELLQSVCNTNVEYPRDAFAHELIERQVEQTPDAVAVVCGRERLTYRQLEEKANQLAWALRETQVGVNSRVGICVERSTNLVVSVLAVLKTGAAYVPLDPAFPSDRLTLMAEDSAISALIIDDRTREDAPKAKEATVINLDAEKARLSALSAARGPSIEAANDTTAAYVIYTSGSTGKPKGVVLPHRAVVNFVTSMAREPGIGPEDRLLAVTTLSFDIAVLELYVPLSVGAQVVIATREMVGDGDLLDEAIDEHGITVMQATPATWRLLLAAGFRGGQKFKVLCGGEAFPRDLAEQLLGVVGEVWNMYGPTETTVWSTCCKLTLPLGDILIGRPIANTTVHVVDSFGGLAPLGTPGELWIGGDGVALGYHARPELTADRFVDNPFAAGRAYKTGDVVRLRSHGELEYLRRNDNQIKLRGYRIELGEIEAALTAHDGIKQAVVLVRELEPGDSRLIGYLKVESNADTSDAALRRVLRERLPDYMIPQHFVTLSEFPLTPNGKVDRRALPDPVGSRERVASDYVSPSTETEIALATLWGEILGISQISARDNFFELGGHSLLCLQMTARFEATSGIRLNPRIILRNNLAQVATLVDDQRANAVSSPQLRVPTPADAGSEKSGSSLARKWLGRLVGR